MNQTMDRLSGLPDSLIHHILSFLLMEDVVRTTVLSKRWNDLWTTVPCLEFKGKLFHNNKFRDFVNRTVILWKGAKIQKFSIVFYEPFSRDESVWVRFALQHKVEELKLSCLFDSEDTNHWQLEDMLEDTGCLLPHCLFSSSSIEKLELYGCDISFHGNIHWDHLKSLEIHDKNVDQLFIDNVLLGSPQLEILDVGCDQRLNICSTRLKKLCLHYGIWTYCSSADEIGSPMHILTPNLEVLEISGYGIKSLFLGVPNLIEATLSFYHLIYDFDESEYELHKKLLRVIFQCINHVEKLRVGDWCIKVLNAMEKTALPSPLLNVKCLTVDTHFGKDCLAGFVNLLEMSPNVAMVAIENFDLHDEALDDYSWRSKKSLIPEVEFSDSILMNLKILKIALVLYDGSLFSLAKFVLKRASALEKIEITLANTESDVQDVILRETQELLRMPRLSPNVEVVFRKHTS